jgi:hypothetical protein
MTPNKDELSRQQELIDFAMGQIHGLTAFAVSLIRTHPSPAALSLEIEKVNETLVAITGPLAVSEKFVEGARDIAHRFHAFADNSLEGQKEIHKGKRGVSIRA